jgi:elongation factor P--(R)-beta-lysine ligase
LKSVKIEKYKLWLNFIEHASQVLKERGYLTMRTPYLLESGAMESVLEPFKSQLEWGKINVNLQLPTSPEFSLKKALSWGLPSLFEIKTCFRNHEISDHHWPEFTMLEFYNKDLNFEDFKIEVCDILKLLVLGSKDTQLKFISVTVAELFKQQGYILTAKSTYRDLKEQCLNQGYDISGEDNFDDLFHRLWIDLIEPKMDKNSFIIVSDYPPSQAALAQIHRSGWADRFEIYWHGFEIGNAFHEQKGANIIKSRWVDENQKREMKSNPPHPIDQEFLLANESLPSCSGIAIGLERLFMAKYGYSQISEFNIYSDFLSKKIF